MPLDPLEPAEPVEPVPAVPEPPEPLLLSMADAIELPALQPETLPVHPTEADGPVGAGP